MLYTEGLRDIRGYGKRVLQLLDDIPRPEGPVNPEMAALLQKIEKAARDTERVAGSPVKIGIVGEFSSGKTMLLGALIGFADALPVSATPSTGNVTALSFEPCAEQQPTELLSFEVHYMDSTTLDACLQYLIATARQRARDAQLRPDLISTIDAAQAGESSTWSILEKWCKDAWQSSPHPGLRFLVAEMLPFIRAYTALGAVLIDHTYTVLPDTAHLGLQLAEPVGNIQTLGFDALPAAPAQLASRPETPTQSLLRDSFPLIHRVEVKVKVALDVWDLSELRGANEFVLLDFPGLGAAKSGARDAFLCMEELKEVQTILILLSGNRPGSGEALKIYNLMQQHWGPDIADRILVGVGRFDELPLQGEGGLQTLGELSGDGVSAVRRGLPGMKPRPGGEGLKEAGIRGRLKPLHEALANAEALQKERKDRIVVLSALHGLLELQNRLPGLRVGSDDFQQRLALEGDGAITLRLRWRELGEKLGKDDPKSPLVRWLRDYAQDGGLTRLRELLGEHVKTHGLKQLCWKAYQTAQGVDKEIVRLRQKVAPAGADAPPPADITGLQKLISQVANIYNEAARNLTAKPPLLQVEHKGRLVPVADVVAQETAFSVCRWRSWLVMLQNLHGDHIKPPTQTEVVLPGGKVIKRGAITMPLRSDDFFAEFQAAVAELEKLARRHIGLAIPHLLASLGEALLPLRTELASLCLGPAVARLQANPRFTENDLGLLELLAYAIDPSQLIEGMVKEFGETPEAPVMLKAERLFPLPRVRRQAHHWPGLPLGSGSRPGRPGVR